MKIIRIIRPLTALTVAVTLILISSRPSKAMYHYGSYYDYPTDTYDSYYGSYYNDAYAPSSYYPNDYYDGYHNNNYRYDNYTDNAAPTYDYLRQIMTDGTARYASYGPNYVTLLGPNMILMSRDGRHFTLGFDGANQNPGMDPYDTLPNYNGSYMQQYLEHLRTMSAYQRIRYNDLYPGISMDYWNRDSHQGYQFNLSSQADPNKLVISLRDVQDLYINENNDLVIVVDDGQYRFPRPSAYQSYFGGRYNRKVNVDYRILDGNRIGFSLGSYNTNRPLYFDPIQFN